MNATRVITLATLAACAPGAPSGQPDHLVTTVTSGGVPVDHVLVIYHDSSGAPLQQAITDQDGLVDLVTEDDAMVTVVDPSPGAQTQLITITHVQVPGTIAVPLRGGLRAQQTPLVVERPAQQPPPRTADFQAETTCGIFDTDSLPVQFLVGSDCVGTTSAVLEARGLLTTNSDIDRVLAIAPATTAPGAGGQAVVAGPWVTACSSISVGYDLPLSVRVVPRLGGHMFGAATADFCPGERPQPGVAGVLPVIDLGEGVVAITQYQSAPHGDLDRANSFAVTAFARAPSAFAPEGDLLTGQITFGRMTSSSASWFPSRDLLGADAVIAQLEWNGSSGSLLWEVIAPADTTAVVLPDVPISLPEIDNANRVLEIDYVSGSAIGGYTRAIVELPQFGLLGTARADVSLDGSTRMFMETFYPDITLPPGT